MRVFPIKFSGVSEAFTKLYNTNLFLTVISLGLFSAWAKVYQRRFFYTNTSISNSSFYFHADPAQVLNKNLIVFTLVVFYFAIEFYSFALATFLFTIFLFLLPELMNNNIQFNRRQTSFRNIHFNFTANYTEAFIVFSLLLILVILSLGLAYPYYVYRRQKYILNHTSYGQTQFSFSIKAIDYYRIYVRALTTLLLGMGMIVLTVKTLQLTAILGGLEIALGLALAIPLILYCFASLSTCLYNYELERLQIDTVYFMTDLNVGKMFWLYLSNFFLLVATVGLLTPTALCRVYQYKLSRTSFCIDQHWSSFKAATLTPERTLRQNILHWAEFGRRLLNK